jgi:hypothetical protein
LSGPGTAFRISEPHWRPRSHLAALLWLVFFLFASRTLLAQKPPENANANVVVAERRYSALELERIRRALLRVGGTLDKKPQGKRIESVEVVTLPVFEPEDPVPQFLNWFHVTTQSYVVEREVLMRIGSQFDQRLSDETERNLRQLRLFSVVIALPVVGSSPDSIRYVLVTKDIWSLRLGWDGRINQGVIDYLSVSPTESNLFGTGRQLFGTLEFNRRTYSVGLGFYEPRLAGSRTRISVQGDLMFNCDTGDIEGSSGSFQYSRPLYSTQTRWAYATSVSWTDGQVPLSVTGNLGGSICSVRADDELIRSVRSGRTFYLPNQYFYDSQAFTQSFTRSFGYRYKTNLSFGLEARRLAYSGQNLGSTIRTGASDVPGDLTPAEDAAARNYYRSLIPVGDTRISPFFTVSAFENNYHRDINSETLGLQEDFAMGHGALLKLYPALEALGSTRNMVGLDALVSYALPVGTGYAKLEASHSVELSSMEQTDAQFSLAFRFTSPRMLLGRFVYDSVFIDHYHNYRNTNLAIGGTTRLRGYQTTAAVGPNYFASNIEFRTRPVEIFSVQLAAVGFYDTGDAFGSFDDLELKHGVGGGIRFLAPQLDRDVFRVDIGFPVPFDTPLGETSVIATFEQAFPVP